ncbi:MAG: vWA domain-containing protein [Candidatus Jordarchaeaceae archaeon]
MKKKVFQMILSFTILFISWLLFSCSNIPTVPSAIPPDPSNVQKPNISDYSNTNIYGSLDKSAYLLPIAVPDYIKVKVSIPGQDNLDSSNFLVFEDDKAQGFAVFKESSMRKAIDIAIIIDCTGSMSDAINKVSQTLQQFADQLSQSGMDVRIAIVPYDDTVNPARICAYLNIDPYLDFSSPSDAKQYVSKITGTTGGAEVAFDAIKFAASSLSWRSHAQKFIIIITDEFDHYGGSSPHTSKSELFNILPGNFIVHGVFIEGWNYSRFHTDYTNNHDVREVSAVTGGMIIHTDRYVNVDLTQLGIVEYIESSWIIAFQSDSPSTTHTIEIFFTKGQDKRYLKLSNVSY